MATSKLRKLLCSGDDDDGDDDDGDDDNGNWIAKN